MGLVLNISISLRYILILSSDLGVKHPSDLFSFSTQNINFVISTYVLHCTHPPSLVNFNNNTKSVSANSSTIFERTNGHQVRIGDSLLNNYANPTNFEIMGMYSFRKRTNKYYN
jgi:hypothetical protein